MYTDRKVYRPLADKLPKTTPTTGDIVRWSVVGDTGRIAAQRAAHFSIYADDPAIAQARALPEEIWDPARPEIGARHNVTWIRMSDVHHTATGNEPIEHLHLRRADRPSSRPTRGI